MDAQPTPMPSDQSPPVPAQAVEKKQARAAVRARRRALAPQERERRSAALCENVRSYLTGLTPVVQAVALYASAPDEPDTAPLLQALANDGIQVYLPVCEPDYALSWVRWTPEARWEHSTRAPVMEPVGERHGIEVFAGISTLFIPALSIDARGLRLGQGGGYYDRFLPGLIDQPVQTAAMVYDDEFVPAGAFATNEYDMSVDLVITPGGTHLILD